MYIEIICSTILANGQVRIAIIICNKNKIPNNWLLAKREPSFIYCILIAEYIK